MKYRFMGEVSDEQVRWGSNDDPRGVLVVGRVYELDREPEVHSWHTKLHIGGKRYNSVNFREACDGDRHIVYPNETLCDCADLVKREIFP